jgi:hypothetical protein
MDPHPPVLLFPPLLHRPTLPAPRPGALCQNISSRASAGPELVASTRRRCTGRGIPEYLVHTR